MLRRLYSVAVPSVIFSLCIVFPLFQISRVDGKTGCSDVPSELRYFERAIYRVIDEEEERRPPKDRVNVVISSALANVNESVDANLLRELAGRSKVG